MIFLSGVSCSTLSKNHIRDPQSASRALVKTGNSIGDIIKRAEAKSPNKPVRDVIAEMGFDIDDIPKGVIDRIRTTNALDNPVNLFFTNEKIIDLSYSGGKISFHKCFFENVDTEFKEVIFLRRLFVERVDWNNSEHVISFRSALRTHFEKMYPKREVSQLFDEDEFSKISSIIGEGKIVDFIASSIHYDNILVNPFTKGLLRDRIMLLVFRSDYFRGANNVESLEYSVLEEAIKKMLFLDQNGLSKLWKQVNDVSAIDESFLLASFKGKVKDLIESRMQTSNPEKMEQTFNEEERLKVLMDVAKEDDSFAELLTDILADIS